MTATATRPTTDAPALVPWSWVVVTTEDDG